MRKFLLASAAAAAALIATPAIAQTNAGFVGPRVEAQVGISDSNYDTTRATYGVALGADVALGSRGIIGADVNASNVLDNDRRNLGAGVRLGYALNPNALGYLRVGYANQNHTDGLTAGGGAEFRISRNAYLNTEYRYTDYRGDVRSHAGLLGVGIRF